MMFTDSVFRRCVTSNTHNLRWKSFRLEIWDISRLFSHFSLLFPALGSVGSESHIVCLLGVGKSVFDFFFSSIDRNIAKYAFQYAFSNQIGKRRKQQAERTSKRVGQKTKNPFKITYKQLEEAISTSDARNDKTFNHQ